MVSIQGWEMIIPGYDNTYFQVSCSFKVVRSVVKVYQTNYKRNQYYSGVYKRRLTRQN